ncbi:methyltransferase domain-containing protein [Pontibacter pamirensis]|uniref:methyltransferase domain-containing protein n=1 Tax=Pontibacter pamirensis TaxID=2562824 RepID=UPI001389AE56|nr:methyltransferase domain-containing protein [Pontibacter pamirensis]
MQFNKELEPYLDSTKFSNGLKVKLESNGAPMQTRMDYIESIVNGKKIIHLGCTDHIPLIKAKISNNQWFHKRLTEKASRCLGVDINEEALSYVKNELGYNDLILHNVVTDAPHPSILETKWDYLILGEILEHVNNPTLLLQTIQEKYGSCIEKMIITVPNAFDYKNFYYSLSNIELINTDHRFWFTPYTLAKIAVEAGLKVDNFEYCLPGELGKREYFKKFFLERYPAFRETLLMTLKF